jgi:hypothetical protein
MTLVVACISGCSRQSVGPTDVVAPQTAVSAASPKMRSLIPIDNTSKLAADTLKAVEQKYGCQLPSDYRKFLLENNGGFPTPDCVRFNEAGCKTASDVFCFFAISDERAWVSMEWHCETYSGRLPQNTLPIARDSCGNLWLLNIGNDNFGSVYFWDHGSYENVDERDLNSWPQVASSFQEFWDNLAVADASSEDGVVPSRYALVKQATDGIVKRNAGFSTRGNPNSVWHSDCDDIGNVSMQLVQYEAHAIATHTCGYSRLRAIKGLIKPDPKPLPE